MNPIPEPLAKILKDFCHVEWYEIEELKEFVNSENLTTAQRQMVIEFKQQLSQAIKQKSITPEQYEELTAEECSSSLEVAAKLDAIKSKVFS